MNTPEIKPDDMNFDDVNKPGASKLPVCLCIDNSADINLLLHDDFNIAARAIIKKHNYKGLNETDTGRYKLTEVIDSYYDEFPKNIREKYGKNKKEMLDNCNNKSKISLTAGQQIYKAVKIFVETLKEGQKDIDVDLCVITFSGGKTEEIIPFSSKKDWSKEEWKKDFLKKLDSIHYNNTEKSMFYGLKKASELIDSQLTSYGKASFHSGRIILLTDLNKVSNEPEDIMEEYCNLLENTLPNYKNIVISAGENIDEFDNIYSTLEFPCSTIFLNANMKDTTEMERVFKAISRSVSSNSPEVAI